MDENIETLVSMGFNDRDLNRRALNKADNDISEAVTFLTGNTFFTDDVIIPAETTTTTMSTFIGPLTKEQLEQQQMVRSVRSFEGKYPVLAQPFVLSMRWCKSVE